MTRVPHNRFNIQPGRYEQSLKVRTQKPVHTMEIKLISASCSPCLNILNHTRVIPNITKQNSCQKCWSVWVERKSKWESWKKIKMRASLTTHVKSSLATGAHRLQESRANLLNCGEQDHFHEMVTWHFVAQELYMAWFLLTQQIFFS